MELPQLKVPITTETAHSTSTTTSFVLPYHDPAPCNGSSSSNNSIDYSKAFFDSLPPGYRFCPTKEELIKAYLVPKIKKEIVPPSHIRDANLYEDSPDRITERYKGDENEWYFFTPRDRKYPNGDRPNRAAGAGFWKAIGADVKIMENGRIIGYKKSLAYHEGKAPNGEKTNWIMHEYRVHHNNKPKEKTRVTMRLDDYVLCKIYKKNNQNLKGYPRGEIQDACTGSTSGKDYKNIPTAVDSSRLMNSCSVDKPLEDRFINEVTPLSYGLFYTNQNMEENISYQPSSNLLYPKYMEEFEDISLSDLDNFLIPIDDHAVSLTHPLDVGSFQLPPP